MGNAVLRIAADMVPMLIEEKKKRSLENLRVGQESPLVPNGADGKTKDLAPTGRYVNLGTKWYRSDVGGEKGVLSS